MTLLSRQDRVLKHGGRRSAIPAMLLGVATILVLSACSPARFREPQAPGAAADPASQTDSHEDASNQPTDMAVYRGAGIAHLGCPQCHDIGVVGAGPLTQSSAPAFAAVANREGMTAAHIEQWLTSSHPTMPSYYFGEPTVSDLAAYIMSLRKH
ncbi:MAG: hypothetical protein GC155_02965 [Alphaproteobacteria bacterium]|nr:hypothetical protein [Alphaproteobacteria bacterium]